MEHQHLDVEDDVLDVVRDEAHGMWLDASAFEGMVVVEAEQLAEVRSRRACVEAANLDLMVELDQSLWSCGDDYVEGVDDPYELEVCGLELERRDPTFWPRLRRFGATPEMVAAANALLAPGERRTRPRPHDPMVRRRVPLGRVRGGGRRGRRCTRRRVAARAGPASDGEPGSAEPPGASGRLITRCTLSCGGVS